MSKAERAQAVHDALAGQRRNGGPTSQRVGRVVSAPDVREDLVITEGPYLVTNRAGEVIGVEVWVEWTIEGDVQDIDPHRVIINPPTHVVTKEAVKAEHDPQVVLEPRETREDPEAAIWAVLWDSVTGHPSPESRAVPRKVTRR